MCIMSRLLILVLLCRMCMCVSTEQRDYGVKLCGREFIRAVIFTCGGSRWKRAILPQPSEDLNFLIQYQGSDKDQESGWSRTNRGAGATAKSLLSASLNDLLQVAHIQSSDQSIPPDETKKNWMKSFFYSRPSEAEFFRSLDIMRPGSDRRKRNFSLGLAGLCCNQGCTKNDIGRLC